MTLSWYKKLGLSCAKLRCAEICCFYTFTGWVVGRGRWDCSRVIIKLNSIQLQLQLTAGTEFVNKQFFLLLIANWHNPIFPNYWWIIDDIPNFILIASWKCKSVLYIIEMSAIETVQFFCLLSLSNNLFFIITTKIMQKYIFCSILKSEMSPSVEVIGSCFL